MTALSLLVLAACGLHAPGDSDAGDGPPVGTAPRCEITAPVASGRYYAGGLTALAGLVSDDEDAMDQLTVQWSSSADGDLGRPRAPSSAGETAASAELSMGEQVVSLTVTDSDGDQTSCSVDVTIGPPNTRPTCAITAPATGGWFAEGDTIAFAALVGDAETPAADLTVRWRSDFDGDLGASIASDSGDVRFDYSGLSASGHTVTLQVTDDRGAVCSDEIRVDVYDPREVPSCEIVEPVATGGYSAQAPIRFEGHAWDTQSLATELIVTWSSDVDGVLDIPGATSEGITAGSATLTEAAHTITLHLSDRDGFARDCAVAISVGP
jgi:hypothetical protein